MFLPSSLSNLTISFQLISYILPNFLRVLSFIYFLQSSKDDELTEQNDKTCTKAAHFSHLYFQELKEELKPVDNWRKLLLLSKLYAMIPNKSNIEMSTALFSIYLRVRQLVQIFTVANPRNNLFQNSTYKQVMKNHVSSKMTDMQVLSSVPHSLINLHCTQK